MRTLGSQDMTLPMRRDFEGKRRRQEKKASTFTVGISLFLIKTRQGRLIGRHAKCHKGHKH